jgi:hypothetical protein
MTNDELDRMLSHSLAEEEIVPSSGFTASVMEAVQREATAPPPIPFPWKRAVVGLVAAALTLVWVLVEIVSKLIHEAATPQSSATWASIVNLLRRAVNLDPGWLALAAALTASLASVVLSMRLTKAEDLSLNGSDR